jgi:hypothetical protein
MSLTGPNVIGEQVQHTSTQAQHVVSQRARLCAAGMMLAEVVSTGGRHCLASMHWKHWARCTSLCEALCTHHLRKQAGGVAAHRLHVCVLVESGNTAP